MRVQAPTPATATAATVPTGERQRLRFAEAERQVNPVDRDGHVDLPLLGARRFIVDEGAFRPNRSLAPDDDHASCGIELGLDLVAPGRATADLLIPPDRKAVCLKRIDQRLHPPPILGLV